MSLPQMYKVRRQLAEIRLRMYCSVLLIWGALFFPHNTVFCTTQTCRSRGQKINTSCNTLVKGVVGKNKTQSHSSGLNDFPSLHPRNDTEQLVVKPGCVFVKQEQITKSNLLTNFQICGLEILKKKKKEEKERKKKKVCIA